VIKKSTSLKYEPSLELLRITAEQMFSNRELYRSVQLSVEELSWWSVVALRGPVRTASPAMCLESYMKSELNQKNLAMKFTIKIL